MATASDISRLLKLDLDISDFSSFVPVIRDGFSKQCFSDFLAGTNIAKAISRLSAFDGIADSNASELSPDASDCLLRIARIYAEALELLGDETAVERWMMTTSLTLGDQLPLELLDTSIGFEMVFQELKRIQYGIAS